MEILYIVVHRVIIQERHVRVYKVDLEILQFDRIIEIQYFSLEFSDKLFFRQIIQGVGMPGESLQRTLTACRIFPTNYSGSRGAWRMPTAYLATP